MKNKEQSIKEIMGLLKSAYTPTSGTYKNVRAALSKFTAMELGGLYAMLLTHRHNKFKIIAQRGHQLVGAKSA